MSAVEASPDGTKLFVGGSFNTVNGVAKQKVASLNLTTGAPLSTFGFTNSTNNQVQSLAATQQHPVRRRPLHPHQRRSSAPASPRSTPRRASSTTTFDNNLSGGIGVNGQLGVPQLKLTHDESKLLVVHTGRQIDGQDRYGMGIIDTATKELLPWRSQLWDDEPRPRRWRHPHLRRRHRARRLLLRRQQRLGRRRAADQRHRDRLPPRPRRRSQDSDVQPLWISRHFDSIYSVAITEVAVYVGGHFGFIESPTSDDPWPGLDNVGYGTGQGLAGYGLGDQVVRRDHIAAINPVDGKALEWNPMSGSNSFEGDKAMEATPRGLFVGGDGKWKGGVQHRPGRVLRLQHGDRSRHRCPTRRSPPRSRAGSSTNNVPFDITGTARVATGTVGRVQVQVQDRDSGQYLQDNGTAFTTFGATANTLNATLLRHRHDPHLVDPGHHHDQPQPAGLRPRRSPRPPVGPATRPGRPRRSSRSAPTDQTPDDQHQRAERRPDVDHLHRDRHGQRRQGRQLAVATGSATSSSATCRTTAP